MSDGVQQHVFVVDDEVKVLEAVAETLGILGVQVTCFIHPAKCLERLRRERCDLPIADRLRRSVRAIEVHRAHVMEKLGASSLLDLVKRAASLGLVDLMATKGSDKSMEN